MSVIDVNRRYAKVIKIIGARIPGAVAIRKSRRPRPRLRRQRRRRRRKSVGAWPRWRSGARPTYASAGACTTWTRRSTSCGARCPRSRTRSACPGSRRSGWPSRTSASWPSCSSRRRRRCRAATRFSRPPSAAAAARTGRSSSTTYRRTRRTRWYRPSRRHSTRIITILIYMTG